MKKIICFLCVLVIILTLSGCDNIVLQPNFNEVSETEKLSEKVVAENNNFTLEWNSSMGVTLNSKSTGEIWGTIPTDGGEEQVDELGMPIKKHPQVESILIVDYIDAETNTEKTLVSYSGSVRDGRVRCEKIDNGMRVEFYFDSAEFMIPVDYILNDDSLSIAIDPTKIQEGKNQIVQISLAPYCCSVKNDTENSYLFIPDGSGALIDVYSRSNQGITYSKQVYGADLCIKEIVSASQQIDIKMPVFGAKNDTTATFAIIEQGAENAWIEARVGATSTGYSSVYATFQMRGYTNHTAELFSSTKVDRVVYEQNMIVQPLKVTYYNLTGEDANYVGMANIYKQYLTETNMLKNQCEDIAFNLDILGGTMITESFLGVPYQTLFTATKLTEAKNIIDDISSVTNDKFSVVLKGFGETGLDIGEIGGGYKLNKKLGSKRELNEVLDLCNKIGAEMYMDFDIMRFKKNGNGFSTFSDSITDASQKRATQYLYDIAVRGEIEDSLYYLLSPSRFEQAANKLLSKTDSWKLSGISLGSISKLSYSDYLAKDEKTYYAKSNFINEISKTINLVKDENKKFLASDANVYTAVLSDVITNSPTVSSKQYVFKEEIPFYQIVFKGYIPMTTYSINLTSNWKMSYLKAIESGCGLNYSLMENWDSSLIDAQHTDMFNSRYNDLKANIKSDIKDFTNYHNSIDGAHISSHEILESGLRKTSFDNGVTVYVNYSSSAVDSPVGVIEAQDYILTGCE